MLFKARLIPVFLIALFFLAGCEERAEPDSVRSAFKLITPVNGSSIYDLDERKIKLGYSINLKPTNILIELNGADITDKFTPAGSSGKVLVDMKKVRNSLVQGDNELLAAEIELDEFGVPVLDVNGRPVVIYSKTFNFFMDTVPPRVVINSVVPNVANVDGSPVPGSTITVQGNMIDISVIDSLSFTSPGGTQVLTRTSNDPVGTNQFNVETKTFSVNLPNYPDPSVATVSPHFSYTITDRAKQTGTEQFMASGTRIDKQIGLQVNDPLGLNLTSLMNAAVIGAFRSIEAVNFFGVARPLYDDPLDAFNSTDPDAAGLPREPVPGEQMKNPRNNCVFPSPDIDNVEECRPSAYTDARVFIFPASSAQCSGLLFKPEAGVTDCVVFIRNLEIRNPYVDFEIDEKKGDLLMNASLWFLDAIADVEIVGARNLNDGFPPVTPDNYVYLGGLKGRIQFSKFTIETDFRLYPDSTHILGMERIAPFRLELTDLLKVPAVTGTCNICSNNINPFVMIALALGTDVNNNDVKDKKELIDMIGTTIENRAGPMLDDALAGQLKSATTIKQNEPVNNKQIIRNSAVVDAYAVYNNNAHFVFNGNDRVAPAFYSPEYLPVNGGLGSTFAPQGKYYDNLSPFIKGWGITIAGVKNLLDLSFAVSANTINQWLLTNHQTAMFAEADLFNLEFTGADIAAADIDGVAAADDLRLTFNTNEAPFVEFVSANPRFSQVCVLGNCFTQEPTPGSVKLVVHDLDINLDRTSAPAAAIVDANIDLELQVFLSVVSGAPHFTLVEDSLNITVNSFTEPDSLLLTNAALATAMGEAIEAYLDSPAFQTLIGPRTELVSLGDLPGIGGSGPNCADPSSEEGTFCVGGNNVFYASLFTGSGAIPKDFALLFRWFTIEKDGTYLSVGLDVREKPPSAWTAGELAENYITWQLRD
jgi:hypothetical protein